MATEARLFEQMATLHYWNCRHSVQRGSNIQHQRVLGPRGLGGLDISATPDTFSDDVENLLPRSHCAWDLGSFYMSATPDTSLPQDAVGYRLKKNHSYSDDVKYFRSFNVPPCHLLAMGLNVRAMISEAKAIRDGARYQIQSERNPLAFNDAVIATLLFVAGLPKDHQDRFREKHFVNPSYDWHSNRSPFNTPLFSDPAYVFRYCDKYAYWN